MDGNKRRSHRINTNVWVRFFRESVDSTMLLYQKGLAENCSVYGMFLATEHPFSTGSVFTLEFEVESETKNRTLVQVRAIVRWAQCLVKHPGMGVEFILFNGLGKTAFRRWLLNLGR